MPGLGGKIMPHQWPQSDRHQDIAAEDLSVIDLVTSCRIQAAKPQHGDRLVAAGQDTDKGHQLPAGIGRDHLPRCPRLVIRRSQSI